ncbi:PD-(D/E)XK nuclease family protein [Gimesia sp.]|uniref:PD-(D/E)XK nuclease family protein n=1 Tax=Gimesia sp. TaxID=2024833 RepID=UPI0032EAA279
MLEHTQLAVRLTSRVISPEWMRRSVNDFHGGPETLLKWLETQLGLPVPPIHKADRITEYAAALDTVTESVITASMKADRWATASELLARRDELLMSGWDEVDSESLPDVVRDLARAVTGRTMTFPGEAERLQRVLDALQAGQVLPPHRCVLHDAPDTWPSLWRKVLAELTVVEPPELQPHAAEGSALYSAQTVVRGGPAAEIEQDSTFRYVHTRSASASVEFVAAVLALAPDKLPTTVICCEDDDLASRLDACLNRIGLPTTGATSWSRAHPVLQVLPLSLALCWEPVDPQALLDFLTLPILPLPRKAASILANALTEEPGLGSSQWEKAVKELCEAENDPEHKLRKRLDAWLFCDRTPRGTDAPSRLIRSRCALVSQWASGQVALLARDADSNTELINAFQIAAGQASLLGELAESQGILLSDPQLARLMEEALANGVETTSCIEAQGGPIRVRSLAEISGPCDRLIWLGLGTGDTTGSRWSTNQLRELRDAGIDLDDGSHALSTLRSAEAHGYSFVKEAFLAVLLPQDLEKRWHPIWLAIRETLPEQDVEQPLVIEDLIADDETAALAPFIFECQDVDIQPPQPPRPLWNIPAKLLRDRETVSATALQDRLSCPLKWTLTYQAKLRPSPIAELPADFQLKGTFCHSVLEHVFGAGGDLPAVEDAVAAVVAIFDERLPLDAAPLAQPGKYFECQQLRSEIENATRVFVGALASGGYRITGIEVELSGDAFGKSLNGWIDCVAQRADGEEAVIDFKYGGRSKYYSLIEDGKAVQLATYAYGRSTASGRFPGVAYLVLSDGLLYTPSESPVLGDGNRAVINAPAIQMVWQQFSDAIGKADDWLTTDAPVPARPLQESSEWPDGATIVLETNLKDNQTQSVCKYCNFKSICGIQEIT